MRHARAADGFNEAFFDNAFLNVERELARALLGCAPTHTVGQAGDVLDFFGLHPLALFGNGSGTMIGAFGHATHVLYFV